MLRVAHYYSLMRLGLELERAGSFAKAVACYTAAKEGAAAEAGDSTLLVADALRALARTHLKRTRCVDAVDVEGGAWCATGSLFIAQTG